MTVTVFPSISFMFLSQNLVDNTAHCVLNGNRTDFVNLLVGMILIYVYCTWCDSFETNRREACIK